MSVTLKMTFSMMKRKKFQILLISFIFVLISTLVYLGLSIMNQTSMFGIMSERANAADELIIFEGASDIGDYENWWQNQTTVESFVRYDSMMIDAKYIVGDEIQTETIFLTEYNNDSVDLLYINGDQYVSDPKENAMYINTNMAKNSGLKVNDLIEVNINQEVHEFIIKEIVVDPHFSTPFVSSNRCFISADYFETNQLEATDFIFGVRYNDAQMNHQNLFDEFQNTVGKTSHPYYFNQESISMSYNIVLSIIGAILLSVSIFIFIIAVFIIRTTLKQIILSQYKHIGLKKVLGYSHQQIRNSYLYQFIIIGVYSSVIGVLLGFPLRAMINKDLSYDMQVGIKTSLDLYAGLTPIIVVFVIGLTTLLIVNKTKHIKPVQAIKYGMPERLSKGNKFSIHNKRLPLVVLLALKQLLVNKRKSMTTIITVILLMFISFTISNTGYTLGESSYLVKHLMGLEVGDFSIQAPSSNFESFINKIESYDEVDEVMYMEIGFSASTYDRDGVIINPSNVTIFGHKTDIIKLSEGRNPQNDSEVIISQVLSDKTGKIVGDYMMLESDLGEKKYLVSGIVRSILNSSLIYISLENDLPSDAEMSDASMGFIWGYGNQSVDIDSLNQQVKKDFGDKILIERYDSNVKTILSTLTDFPIVVNTLLVIFVSVCGVIFVNSTIMDVNQDAQVYGIMKATGYSNGMIIKVLLFKTIIMTGIGLVIGFLICLLTMNIIMQGVFNISPFSSIHMPMLLNVGGNLALILIFLIISVIGTLIPARRIIKISPKLLISE